MLMQHPRTSLDLKLGNVVVCRDGRAGRVTKLVVDPGSKHVTHIIVQHGLLHHAVVVPIEHVAQVQDDTLVLTLDLEELAALPRFAEVDYTLPNPAWSTHLGHRPATGVDPRGRAPSGIPLAAAWTSLFIKGHTHRGMSGEEIPIGRGTRITCRDGQVGRLDHVLLDPESDTVHALVVRTRHLLGKDVIVPADRVAWIAEDEIRINADHSPLEGLPE